MSIRTKALLAVFIAAMLWASAAATAKTLFLEVPPLTAAFHRFFLAWILLVPFVWKTKKPKRYLVTLLPLGLFNAGNILFYYTGIALTTANTSTIIGTAVPLLTTLFSWMIIGEKPSTQKFTGIIIGLVGAVLIVLTPLIQTGTMFSGNIYGNLLLTGSLISWSLYITFSRRILSRGDFSPLLSTFVNIMVVALTTGVGSLIFHKSLGVESLIVPTYLGVLVYAAVGITIITIFLFQWAVQHVSASTASLKEYLQLVLGIGLNAVILGERLTASYLFGGLLIVTGIMLATGQRLTRKLAALLFSQGE